MDILNKHITSFSFDNIVTFCKQGYREGWQLDYKTDLPKNGLAKHFAAFSNTRGGVIIVGVEEDKKTGVPIKWEGVINDSKQIERVNQWASNVEPIPSYELHPTNEVNGKIFILVRIYEGDRTPYYVQNDPNIWVRTGNTSKSIDNASPDAIELMFGKREKAKLARTNYIMRAQEVFDNALQNAEQERKVKVRLEKEKWTKENSPTQVDQKPLTSYIYSKELGSEAAIATIEIQPYYPNQPFANPKEIMDKRMEIRNSGKHQLNFPSLNLSSLPDGVYCFDWGENNGEIDCEQIYSTGLVHRTSDILRVDRNTEDKQISMYRILNMLFEVLMATKNFYLMFGYQGGVVGSLQISGVKHVKMYPISINRALPREFIHGIKEALLPKYNWPFLIDTTLLNNDKSFQSFYVTQATKIEWDIGYSDTNPSIIEHFLKEQKWFVE